jgi:hypothetical protein
MGDGARIARIVLQNALASSSCASCARIDGGMCSSRYIAAASASFNGIAGGAGGAGATFAPGS